jgi:hypothetical protein
VILLTHGNTGKHIFTPDKFHNVYFILFLCLQLMLTEIYYDGFHRTFRDNQPLSDIHETDGVFAIQMPVPYIDTLKANQYPEHDYIIIVLLNKVGVGPKGQK